MSLQHWETFQNQLSKRISTDSLRTLKTTTLRTDFCSNDYLGLARNNELKNQIQENTSSYNVAHLHGSTGSRLLSGHSDLFDEVEQELANIHQSNGALIFNSGYVANLAVFSTLPQKGDVVLYDELVHACIKDGLRLSVAEKFSFKHNDLNDLETKLERFSSKKLYIAIESIYSMDGDAAPLSEIALLANKYNALIIVDEAHSSGIFGKNGSGLWNELNLPTDNCIRVHTFGKAIGCHGAVVISNELVKNYLINFARPFIYTTAMPATSLLAIRESYKYIQSHPELQTTIQNRIARFKLNYSSSIDSFSAIQAVIIPGIEQVKLISKNLTAHQIDCKAILSPTVKEGTERLRVCLHTYNTIEEIDLFTHLISEFHTISTART